MSKRINITGVDIGGAVTTLALYHTAITASNLITSSLTPAQLIAGYTAEVPDNVTTIFAECESGECNEKTGSVTFDTYNQNTRWFSVNSDGSGTVSITFPISDGPTTGSLEQSVNFTVYSQFVISAAASYPITFDGWYTAPTGGSLVSTDNPLTITLSTHTSTDDFYARFS